MCLCKKLKQTTSGTPVFTHPAHWRGIHVYRSARVLLEGARELCTLHPPKRDNFALLRILTALRHLGTACPPASPPHWKQGKKGRPGRQTRRRPRAAVREQSPAQRQSAASSLAAEHWRGNGHRGEARRQKGARDTWRSPLEEARMFIKPGWARGWHLKPENRRQ